MLPLRAASLAGGVFADTHDLADQGGQNGRGAQDDDLHGEAPFKQDRSSRQYMRAQRFSTGSARGFTP